MKILCNNYSIILNGINKKFSSVFVYKSNLTLSFLDVLIREGIIRSYNISGNGNIEVFLKYYKGLSVLNNIRAISTSGQSVSYSILDMYRWKNSYSPLNSFLILNTSKGIFSSNELPYYKVGGQVLCIIN
jgi:ribosomal protein S8